MIILAFRIKIFNKIFRTIVIIIIMMDNQQWAIMEVLIMICKVNITLIFYQIIMELIKVLMKFIMILRILMIVIPNG